LLSATQKDLLVQEVTLTRGVLADIHEAGSENTLTIMKEVRSVAKAEVVDTQTVEVPRLHARYEHAWLTTLCLQCNYEREALHFF